jgi:hypothetical protein
MTSPIKLTIYDPQTHEPKKELQTSLVPWGILKRAIKLAKSLDYDQKEEDSGDQINTMLEKLGEDGFDNLTGLVADVFHGQVTIEEIEWGTETGEMINVLQAVVTRAFSEFKKTGNPT